MICKACRHEHSPLMHCSIAARLRESAAARVTDKRVTDGCSVTDKARRVTDAPVTDGPSVTDAKRVTDAARRAVRIVPAGCASSAQGAKPAGKIRKPPREGKPRGATPGQAAHLDAAGRRAPPLTAANRRWPPLAAAGVDKPPAETGAERQLRYRQAHAAAVRAADRVRKRAARAAARVARQAAAAELAAIEAAAKAARQAARDAAVPLKRRRNLTSAELQRRHKAANPEAVRAANREVKRIRRAVAAGSLGRYSTPGPA